MIRIVAPSTGHITRGSLSAESSVHPSTRSSSIAPNPPTITSSRTCSTIERNESSGFSASKFSVSTWIRCGPCGICSCARPLSGWIRHRIPTIRSLITLIARRATGVSANLRRLAGVGFGTRLCGADLPRAEVNAPARENPGEESGARFDPAPTVRRPSREASKLVESHSREDTFPIRRKAPRTFSRMFMNLPVPGLKPRHPERGLLLTKYAATATEGSLRLPYLLGSIKAFSPPNKNGTAFAVPFSRHPFDLTKFRNPGSPLECRSTDRSLPQSRLHHQVSESPFRSPPITLRASCVPNSQPRTLRSQLPPHLARNLSHFPHGPDPHRILFQHSYSESDPFILRCRPLIKHGGQ